MIPLVIILLIIDFFNLNLKEYIGSFLEVIGLLILAYQMFLPGYRAKLASDAYGDRDMELWRAHKVSGAELRTQLSFLPIIGNLFKTKS